MEVVCIRFTVVPSIANSFLINKRDLHKIVAAASSTHEIFHKLKKREL